MDLELDTATADFRDEVREWLSGNVPQDLPSFDTEDGFTAHREWERRLSEARLSVVNWPEEFGGRNATLLQWVIFEEEYYAAGAPPRVNQNGLFMLAPTLREHGNAEQQARLLPPMARGEHIWAQAWSEPEAGSDIAALRSTARRVDGGWRLNGQKTWSSRAAFADRAFGLFRSEAGSRRQRGLSYFMVDLRAVGVQVRPIEQLGGNTGFAEIFLDDVFVPEQDLIGAEGEGWRVAMTTANNERGLSLRSPGRFLHAAERLVELWENTGKTTSADDVADAWIAARAYQLYTFGTVSKVSEGATLGPESSLNKLFWSQLDLRLHETALDILGAEGELAGDWMDGYLFSLAGPIYGGTNQIQRSIVAERLLGLPREKKAGG